jgi:hypothetical protein
MVQDGVDAVKPFRRQEVAQVLITFDCLPGEDARQQQARHDDDREDEQRHDARGEIRRARQEQLEGPVGRVEHDGQDDGPGDRRDVGEKKLSDEDQETGQREQEIGSRRSALAS